MEEKTGDILGALPYLTGLVHRPTPMAGDWMVNCFGPGLGLLEAILVLIIALTLRSCVNAVSWAHNGELLITSGDDTKCVCSRKFSTLMADLDIFFVISL